MESPAEATPGSDGGCQRSAAAAEWPARVQRRTSARSSSVASAAGITSPTSTPAGTSRSHGDGDDGCARRPPAQARAEAESANTSAAAPQPLASFADAAGLVAAAVARRQAASAAVTAPVTAVAARTSVPLLARPVPRVATAAAAPPAATWGSAATGGSAAEAEKTAYQRTHSGTATPTSPGSSSALASLTPAAPSVATSTAPTKTLSVSSTRAAGGAGFNHRAYQPSSLFGAEGVNSSASSSMMLLADPTRRNPIAALGPLSSSGGAPNGPADSDVTVAAGLAGAGEAVVAEAPHAESGSASSSALATARVRRPVEKERPGAAADASDGGSAERDARVATGAAPAPHVDEPREGGAAAPGAKTAAAPTRVGAVTVKHPPLMTLSDLDAQRPAASRGVGASVGETEAEVEETDGGSDLQFFSGAAAPTMHLARYSTCDVRQRPAAPPAASDVEPRSHSGVSGSGGSKAVSTAEPAARVCTDSANCTHLTDDSELEHPTMASLVSYVAVPASVQAVLRNPDATREELWTALRTACQQCGVLQRRLARAEGALRDEGDNSAAAAASAGSPTRQARTTAPPPLPRQRLASVSSIPASDADVQPSSAAPPSPSRMRRSSNPGQRARERLAERAAAAAATASLHAAALSAQTAALQHRSGATSPHAADGRAAGGDVTAVLRDRVAEVIRRVEADRRAPGAAAAAAGTQSGSRSGSVHAGQDAPPRLAKSAPQMPPLEERRAADAETAAAVSSSTDGTPATAAGTDDDGDDSASPPAPALPSRRSSVASFGAAAPPAPTAARRSFGSAERVPCMHPPSPPRSRAGGGSAAGGRGGLGGQQPPPPQQPPHSHHRPRDLPSICLDSPPAAAAAEDGAAETTLPGPWLPRCLSHGSTAGALPPPAMSPTLPNLTHRSHATAAAGGGGGAAALATSLSGTLPSLASSSQSGRPVRDSARLRQQQQQQQAHSAPKTGLSRTATLRQSDEGALDARGASPRPPSPAASVLSAASVTLEMLRQLQQEDAPVPPPAVDEKAALRQWRREAAKVKSSQGAT